MKIAFPAERQPHIKASRIRKDPLIIEPGRWLDSTRIPGMNPLISKRIGAVYGIQTVVNDDVHCATLAEIESWSGVCAVGALS